MAITRINTSTGSTGYNQTIDVTVPTGAGSGDLMVVLVGGEASSGPTANESFTTIGTWHSVTGIGYVGYFYKILDGTEGSTVSFTFSTAGGLNYIAAAYSGVASTNPLDDYDIRTYAVSTTTLENVNGVTTTAANDLIIFIGAIGDGAATFSGWSSGLTEAIDWSSFGLADGIQASAGDSGSKSVTLSQAPNESYTRDATLLAFKAAVTEVQRNPVPMGFVVG